ncbi:hypothetical protein OPV22_029433 [Ensete ventricosum]|uniref:DEK C-terminal domain-containing protein n=1 Tax=Ensete ventricosum TaxID=4639 RepID=A0AAV8QBB5_ENSVE|nr:hypothetical protein OPV22_029433 [Ensete ventricosum]
MDSEAQPKPSIPTKKTPSSSPVDPPAEPPAKAAAPETSSRPPADQNWTPEKPVRSAANRSDELHLYIMPEAIMIKKVLLHDETTCCMKPELQITLQVDAVAENINGESGTMTRAELIHKLISNNLNIVDPAEAEEQLKLSC